MAKLTTEERAQKAIELAEAVEKLDQMRKLIDVQEAKIDKLCYQVQTGEMSDADAQAELPLGEAEAEFPADEGDDAPEGLEQIEAQEAERLGEELLAVADAAAAAADPEPGDDVGNVVDTKSGAPA